MDVLLDLHTAGFGKLNPLYVRARMSHSIVARLALLLVGFRSASARWCQQRDALTTLCFVCRVLT